MRAWLIRVLIATSLILAACGAQATPASLPFSPTSSTPGAELPGASTLTPGPRTHIVIWLAPAFDPTSGSPAADLLAQRLAEFEQANPGLVIEARLKAESGPGGLLESLTAANEAAPAALPDLVTLDPVALNAAAVKGLIAPLDELIDRPAGPEWYPYAQAAALIDGAFYGLPLGSSADVLAYRIDAYAAPPLSWADLLTGPAPILFPAGDPTAAFTLAQYLALGGSLLDDTGRPTLDPSLLADILEFYSSSRAAGVLPLASRQHGNASSTWAVLRQGRATAAVAPLRSYLVERDTSLEAAVPLPTRDGSGICFASAWSWALVSREPARQQLLGRLLAWLSEPDFLGPWLRAMDLLPPTASALATWPRDSDTVLASRLATTARPIPSAESLVTFGPPLQRAVESVLSAQLSPEAAALAASQAVRTP